MPPNNIDRLMQCHVAPDGDISLLLFAVPCSKVEPLATSLVSALRGETIDLRSFSVASLSSAAKRDHPPQNESVLVNQASGAFS